jgi:probable DNA metabolism protein
MNHFKELAYIDGIIHKVADFDLPLLSDNEEKFQKLWKLFFENVTIKKRKNLKLQQNFVPLLYRKYMTEFS